LKTKQADFESSNLAEVDSIHDDAGRQRGCYCWVNLNYYCGFSKMSLPSQ